MLDSLKVLLELENEAYFEFIHWAMNREHQAIMSVPVKKVEDYFIPYEPDGDSTVSFAFGSMDFRRNMRPFDKYHYRLKKIFERARDIAETYSCISDKQGKENTQMRFRLLVEREFRDEAKMLIRTLNDYGQWCSKVKLLEKVTELNNHIRKCNEIWKEHAYAQ